MRCPGHLELIEQDGSRFDGLAAEIIEAHLDITSFPVDCDHPEVAVPIDSTLNEGGFFHDDTLLPLVQGTRSEFLERVGRVAIETIERFHLDVATKDHEASSGGGVDEVEHDRNHRRGWVRLLLRRPVSKANPRPAPTPAPQPVQHVPMLVVQRAPIRRRVGRSPNRQKPVKMPVQPVAARWSFARFERIG